MSNTDTQSNKSLNKEDTMTEQELERIKLEAKYSILGLLPASSKTCTCQTCQAVNRKVDAIAKKLAKLNSDEA